MLAELYRRNGFQIEPDLFVISTFDDQPKYYRNRGDSAGVWLGFVDESSTRFPTLTVDPLQFCAGWSGDLNGDTHLDLYLVNYNPAGACDDVLLINDGTGHFTDETSSRMNGLQVSAFGTGVEIHDADGDGDNDIIKNSANPGGDVGPWFGSGVYVIYNDGTGNFSTWQQMPSSASYMFTSGDLDGDGDVDHYVVDDNQDYVNISGAAVADTSVSFTQNTLAFSPRTTNFGGNCKLIDLDNDGDLDLGIASVDVDIPPCENSRKLDLMAGLCDAYAIYIQGDPLSPSTTITDASGAGAMDGAIDLTLGAGTGPYTFAWSNGASTEDISGLAPGIYSCSITDATGCADWIEVEVSSGAICWRFYTLVPIGMV